MTRTSSSRVWRFVFRLFLRRTVAAAAIALATCAVLPAQEKPKDYSDKNLEDLMNMDVTSVSKKEQKISHVAAAIFVISQEDISRSGATNVPDLLRMVPGLDIAETSSSIWAVSSRGFNSAFAAKLLVLIDGRTVYTPLFGGTYWDTQDVPFADIDRIEVIRGPGATVWGANAVNGVINIITKKTESTLGAYVSAGGGTHEKEFGTAQYGGKTGTSGSYRAFTSYRNEGGYPSAAGTPLLDGWRLLHGGFRIDQNHGQNDAVTLQGDLYAGEEGVPVRQLVSISPIDQQTVYDVNHTGGGNVLGRWHHTHSNGSDSTFQVYFDRYQRDLNPSKVISETRNTVDLDFQNHLALGNRNDLVWGLGFRTTWDHTTGTEFSFLTPSGLTANLFSCFLQDEITLKPNRLFLTLGTKIEHNDFSGFDAEPSLHIVWNLSNKHSVWAGISDAARSIAEYDANSTLGFTAFPGQGGIPVVLEALGAHNLKSEREVAYELGYRSQITKTVSLDVAGFYNDYTNLLGFVSQSPFPSTTPPPFHLVLPLVLANSEHASAQGVELAAEWKPWPQWTISPGYTFFEGHQNANSPTEQSTPLSGNGSDPRHQAQLRSHVKLPHRSSWDLNTYFVGHLVGQSVPSYTRLDSQLTFAFREHGELDLVGQNLLRDRHLEFLEPTAPFISSLVKRSAYLRVSWHF